MTIMKISCQQRNAHLKTDKKTKKQRQSKTIQHKSYPGARKDAYCNNEQPNTDQCTCTNIKASTSAKLQLASNWIQTAFQKTD